MPRRRPGGRTERVRKQVATAVLKLLEDGKTHFRYQDIVDASGVSKVTLYRRWPKRRDLLREALTEHNALLKIPSSNNWPRSAELMLRRFAAFVASPAELAMNVALISDPTDESSALMLTQWDPIQEKIVSMARSAQASGELPADLDPTALMYLFMAPILVTTFLQRQRIDGRLLNQMLEILRRMRFAPA